MVFKEFLTQTQKGKAMKNPGEVCTCAMSSFGNHGICHDCHGEIICLACYQLPCVCELSKRMRIEAHQRTNKLVAAGMLIKKPNAYGLYQLVNA